MIEIDDATWDRAREIFHRKRARHESWSEPNRGTQQTVLTPARGEAPAITVISEEARARYVELARHELETEAAWNVK